MPGLKLWMLLAAVAGVGVLLGAGIAFAGLSGRQQASVLLVAAPVGVLALHRLLFASIRRTSSRRPLDRPAGTDPREAPR